MKIALIGYGRMGKIIEQVARSRNHQIELTVDLNNLHDFTKENLSKVDVAIEFTGPHTAFENVQKCISYNTPVVCGSTGWLDKLPIIEEEVKDKNGSFLCASNFSIGVNIFFELNKKLAQLMTAQDQYRAGIKEIHHTQKLDAPSGTAITLAEQILSENHRYENWVTGEAEHDNQLPILSERIDPFPGWHEVNYKSDIDDIQIIHNAHNRNGFAVGAVIAAEYIYNKKGIFTMRDVLGFGN
jgi:4-hydroxy-tetrahydrodipicolinate reductase